MVSTPVRYFPCEVLGSRVAKINVFYLFILMQQMFVPLRDLFLIL